MIEAPIAGARKGDAMSAVQWIALLALGGLAGMIGQGVRVIAGMKKIHDQVQQQNKKFGELFQLSQLLLSLLIGFIAGAVATLALNPGQSAVSIDRQSILTLLAAGYAGTDFIEAIIKKYVPG
jgi:hypothetical protein